MSDSIWKLVLTLSLLNGAACLRLDEDPDVEEETEVEPRAARTDKPAQEEPLSTSPSPRSDRSRQRPIDFELPTATLAECTSTVLAPVSDCFEEDLTEPNDEEQPVTLPVDPACGYVEANISAGDEDAFSFTTVNSDPVLIELSYLASGTADLEQSIYGGTGSLLDSESQPRKGAGEELQSVIQSTAGASYVVRIRDAQSSKSCQSYALRVDPHYCGDDYEDNDTLETATPLQWDAQQLAIVQGNVLDRDDDYFEVVTERADPVLLSGSYTADPKSSVQLRRTIYNGAGSLVTSVDGARKTAMERFEHWLPAPSAGSVVRTKLVAIGDGCASYELSFDAAGCTDAYEDNDAATEAAKIRVGADLQATIHSTDEDHYAVSPLKNASCSLSYDIPSGRSEELALTVYDAAGSVVTNGSGGELTGTVRNLTVAWTNGEVVRLKVTANSNDYCQPYTLRCDLAPGQ